MYSTISGVKGKSRVSRQQYHTVIPKHIPGFGGGYAPSYLGKGIPPVCEWSKKVVQISNSSA